MLPSRLKEESEGAGGGGMTRTDSNAPLLMNAPSLPSSQAFGALLEQARQVSGQLVGPSFHSLEIQTEPSDEPGPNKSWDNPPSSSRQNHSSGTANPAVSCTPFINPLSYNGKVSWLHSLAER